MSSHRRFIRLSICFISLLMALGLVVGLDALLHLPVVQAAGITVNTTTDELNSDGDCSLREAIQAANTDAAVDNCAAGSGADTITLPAGTYTLTIAGANEDLNAMGDLDITDTLTLDGADMATTIINANNLDRALHMPTAGVTLTLLNLTMRNGNVGGAGGGLYATGPVVVSNTAFVSNTANNYYGGGAYFGGTATVTGATFTGNTAGSPSGGGGAWFSGGATVTGTTFTSNMATSGSGGGAVFFGAATVTGTTFLSNTAGSYGGGARFQIAVMVTGTTFLSNTAYYGGGAFFGGAATVTDTTFQDNTATSHGGGAFFSGAAMVADTTFVSNTANQWGGGVFFGSFKPAPATGDFVNTLFAANRANSNQGAGLYAANSGGDDVVTLRHVTIASPTVGSGSAVYVLNGMVNITNTIVASYSVGLERAGGVLNENYNLFSGVATPYIGTIVSGGNSMIGAAAFADTTSYKLSDASAAIDNGTNVGVTSDFEGDARPLGGGFDIGWDEYSGAYTPITGLAATNDSPTPVGNVTAFTATISTGTGAMYQWNFGDGTALEGGAMMTYTYAAAGNYTALVTATNSVGSVNASTPVTITDVPINGLNASSSSPTRLTDPTFFTATIITGTGVTYQWNFGDGQVGSGPTTAHTYATVGSYTALVTATNTINTVTTTTPVTITNLAPVADAGSDQNVNVSALATLDGSASTDPDGHLPLTYGWTQTGGPAVTLTNAALVSPTFTAPASPTVLTFTLIVTDSTGLADATPDTVVVTVSDVAIDGLSAANSSPTRLTDPTFFTATISAGTNITYQWNFGDNSALSNLQSPTHTYATVGSYTALVMATNSLSSVSASTLVTITQAGFKLYLPLITKQSGTALVVAPNVPSSAALDVAREIWLSRRAWVAVV